MLVKPRMLASLLFALVGVVLLGPPRAEAQVHKNLLPGLTVIGNFGGQAWAVTWVNLFSCQWQSLGSGGLDADYVIHGSAFADNIFVNEATVNFAWCGTFMQPLVQNGHMLTLEGEGGNDVLRLGEFGEARGEGGNDDIFFGNGGGRAYGGSGNDRIFGLGSTSDLFFGESGDDLLCAKTTPSLATVMDGGTHLFGDTGCGSAGHGQNFNIEFQNCAPCGPGYP